MSELKFKPRGLYFEEFEIGQTVISQGRTITEADVVNFAGLSGDYNQIHTDDSYAAAYDFGERIAHGMLVQSIATGLAVMTGFMEGTVMAFRELDVKFSQVVKLGDTIHVELEIVELKAFRRLGGGNVIMKFKVVNQTGDVVQRGSWTMLVKSRDA
ncbi:MAG: MaoC family dehydratase N-terminal domain-containing protein [Anaerolineales bacterium]|nr:MaoC family dehydratase N-terminal domain-containing protein [Anaerolineales bacterium]